MKAAGTDWMGVILGVLGDWRVLAALGFTLVMWVVFRNIGVLYKRPPRPRVKAKGKKAKPAAPSPAPQTEPEVEA